MENKKAKLARAMTQLRSKQDFYNYFSNQL